MQFLKLEGGGARTGTWRGQELGWQAWLGDLGLVV
jgi:hypothetical protein